MDWTIEVIVVPVSDVERSKRFYHEQLGFAVDTDFQPSESFRVVQLTPPGSACSISIGVGLASMPPGSLKGLQICVPDIQAAHAQLVERGVAVSAVQHFEDGVQVEGPGGPWNSFIFFDDPDGNSWTIQEKPAKR
ncbi:MAG TPA: VOC family protein [Ktedonobacterales bacterium]|nr:VOC family protein [Ktedonobacterales bacterium]